MLLFRYLSSIAQGTRMFISFEYPQQQLIPLCQVRKIPKISLTRILQIGKKYLFGDLGAELIRYCFLVSDTNFSISPCLCVGFLFLSLGTLKMTVLCHSINNKWLRLVGGSYIFCWCICMSESLYYLSILNQEASLFTCQYT